LDFKRALVGLQKGTFYKPIGRLLEAKRACIQNHDVKKIGQNNKQLVQLDLLS